MPLAESKTDGKVYLCLYRLLIYLYNLIHNFPKEYKYTLGGEIISLCWEALDWVVVANEQSNDKKDKYIKASLVSFKKFRYRVRMANELKLISNEKMGYLIERECEITKMLVGWYNWAQNKN